MQKSEDQRKIDEEEERRQAEEARRKRLEEEERLAEERDRLTMLEKVTSSFLYMINPFGNA